MRVKISYVNFVVYYVGVFVSVQKCSAAVLQCCSLNKTFVQQKFCTLRIVYLGVRFINILVRTPKYNCLVTANLFEHILLQFLSV